MLGGEGFFDTPKPLELIERVLDLAANEDSLILDAFAGSGTTGHAVLRKNKSDNGKRRFVLIEHIEAVATDVTAMRLSKAVNGYSSSKKEEFTLREEALNIRALKNGANILEELENETVLRHQEFDSIKVEIRENKICLIAERGKTQRVEGLGGGFRFCRLGVPMFDEFGDIATEVAFPDLAAHIFFSETGVPIPKKPNGALLGVHQGRAVYLLFDAANAQTPREAAGNVLTPDKLTKIPVAPKGFEGVRVVYAEGCTVSAARLKAAGVVFKQIPYQVEGAR